MIKKIIACITICFIITGIISPVFSDASALPQPNWSDPGISEIINISDLTGWMLNGGTFDVSQYTDAESFMNDYFNARTKTRLVSPGEAAEDYYEVLPGFGINNQLVAGNSFSRPLDTNRVISSSFRDHTGYGRRLSNEVNDALLSTGHLYDTKIPLLNEIEFANFVGYNHDALKLYINSFISDNPNPTPNPDPDFSFINNVNVLWSAYYSIESMQPQYDRYFQAQNAYSPNDALLSSNPTLDKYSVYCPDTLGRTQYTGDRTTYPIYTFSSISIYLTTNQDSTVTARYNAIQDSIHWVGGRDWTCNYFTLQGNLRDNRIAVWNVQTLSAPSFQTDFAGISTAINYVYQHFYGINLFVDNIPWAIVESDTPDPITPEFPDAVGGEDLPATTWPISRPRAPYFTSVPGMLQAIEDAIADDGELDLDDLKPYLTDENGDPVPDPIFDPEPVPIPVPDPVNPDVVPGLPVLPAMPPEMPGFSGVSVLAEIINFTNQSLPTSLIVTFWGIVFGIVILGLIKILHK